MPVVQVTRAGIEVRWTCPHCSAPNIDLFDETLSPLCERCGAEFEDWEGCVDDATYARANAALKALDESREATR